MGSGSNPSGAVALGAARLGSDSGRGGKTVGDGYERVKSAKSRRWQYQTGCHLAAVRSRGRSTNSGSKQEHFEESHTTALVGAAKVGFQRG
jgi:hypothetical protein